MPPDVSNLTLDELNLRYDEATDDAVIAALEEEIAARSGFENADVYYERLALQDQSNPRPTYTLRTSDEDAASLKRQGYYRASEDHDNADGLCEFCKRLDFKYFFSNPIAPRELSLGYLEDISQKPSCPFCRLVVASISLALGVSEVPSTYKDDKIEVGLTTVYQHNDLEILTYNIELVLYPMPRGSYPTIQIQRYSLSDANADLQGRLISPTRINMQMVRRWISECELTVSPEPTKDEAGFMPTYLIDVLKGCVVSPDDPCRYLALSYVWGGPQPLQLLLENLNKMQTPGVFADLDPDIPATIRDAMTMTRLLGERYIWVDALCIVQDDYARKEPELRSMDDIYFYATLTIIAGYGSSAYAGLPGVRDGTRNSIQHLERIQDLLIVNRLLTSKDTIDGAVWNSRAWTYQERILAKRKLFVSATQVTFKCQHTEQELCEDVRNFPTRSSLASWKGKGGVRSEKWNTSTVSEDEAIPTGAVNTVVYSQIVQKFTSRQLSFANDILNAFIGVSNRLAPLFKDGFRFGLPKNELDTQLLWQPQTNIKRRIDLASGRPIYPSWSWAGWEGEVIGNFAGRESTSNIEFQHDITHEWFNMDQCRGITPSSAQSKWRAITFRGHTFWQEGSNTDTFFAHPIAEFRGFHQSYRPRLKNNQYGSAEVLPIRADTVRLRLSLEVSDFKQSFVREGIHVLQLHNEQEAWAGIVLVPTSVAGKLEPGKYTCIKVSTTRTDVDAGLYGDEPSTPIPFGHCFDSEQFDTRSTARNQVDLLVVRIEDGIAIRIGVGTCHLTAFLDAKPQREVLHLG